METKPAVVVACIDYRFWPSALPLLESKLGKFDLIELAGGSKNIASPLHESDRHAVLESIKIAINVHHAETLVLTNHSDCAAYGGSKNFASREKETVFHKKELLKAKKIAQGIFPQIKIETVFINKNTENKIELIK